MTVSPCRAWCAVVSPSPDGCGSEPAGEETAAAVAGRMSSCSECNSRTSETESRYL